MLNRAWSRAARSPRRGIALPILTILALAVASGAFALSSQAKSAGGKKHTTTIVVPAPKPGDVSFAVAQVTIKGKPHTRRHGRGTVFGGKTGGLAITATSRSWKKLRATTHAYVAVSRVAHAGSKVRNVVFFVVRRHGKHSGGGGSVKFVLGNARARTGSFWVKRVNRHGVATVFSDRNAIATAVGNWTLYLHVLKLVHALSAAEHPRDVHHEFGPARRSSARLAQAQVASDLAAASHRKDSVWFGGQRINKDTRTMGRLLFGTLSDRTAFLSLKQNPLVPRFIRKDLKNPKLAAAWTAVVSKLPLEVPDKYAFAAQEEKKFSKVTAPKITSNLVAIADTVNADFQATLESPPLAKDNAALGQRVRVHIVGTGKGHVSISLASSRSNDASSLVAGSAVNCPRHCSAFHPRGTLLRIDALPDPGSSLGDWRGCNRGTHHHSGEDYCWVSVGTGNTLNVYARFDPHFTVNPADHDTTWPSNGHTGIRTFAHDPDTTEVDDVGEQSNGKLVVLGKFACPGCPSSPTAFPYLRRLNTDGSDDLTFHDATSPSGFYAPQRALITPNDGIETVGVVSGNSVVFTHYDKDGNQNVAPATLSGVGSGTQILAMVRQPGGKIDIVGSTFVGGSTLSEEGLIIQLKSDYTLDTGFGPGGQGFITYLATVNSSPVNTYFYAAGTQSNNQIIVGGQASPDGLVAAFNGSTGDLVGGFGSSGTVLYPPPTGAASASIGGLVTDGSDRVLTAQIAPTSPPKVTFARLSSSGTTDSTFSGNQGSVSVAFPTNYDPFPFGAGMSLDPKGNLVLGGTTRDGVGNMFEYMMRLTSTFAPDAGFGINGRFIGDPALVNTFRVDSVGKYLIGGQQQNRAPRDGYVARYNGAAAG